MRSIIFMLLILAVSCGKKNTESTGPHNLREDVREEEVEGIEVSQPVELLDLTLDEEIEINGNQIVFRNERSAVRSGDRTMCAVSINKGDVYSYSLSGDRLNLQTPDGAFTLKRVGNAQASILGSWSGSQWQDSKFIIRKFTFLSANRLIMNIHCEG
jgi:hypothetical protein